MMKSAKRGWCSSLLLLLLLLPATILALECGEFTALVQNNILETRIVNGQLAQQGEFPWQVSMQRQVRLKLQDTHNNSTTSATNNSTTPAPGNKDKKIEILSEDEILEATLWFKSLWPKLVLPNGTVMDKFDWPPPLPTHPPSVSMPPMPTHGPGNTIPPLPTHPPSKFPWSYPPNAPHLPQYPPGYPPRPPGPPVVMPPRPPPGTIPGLPPRPPGSVPSNPPVLPPRPPSPPGPSPPLPVLPPRPPPPPPQQQPSSPPPLPPAPAPTPSPPQPPPPQQPPPVLPPRPPGGTPGQGPPVLPPRPPPVPTRPPGPIPIPTRPPGPQPQPHPIPTQRPIPLPTQRPQPGPQPTPRPPPPPDRFQRWQHFCGGSIIDNSWILTAAHCVEGMKHTYRPGTIRIVAGSLNWKNYDEQNAQVISVDRVMVHDGWTQKIGQNDIALLHLATPIQYVQKDRVIVNKVCLSREADSEHSGMATSSGWGFLNKDTRVTPEMLRRVDIPVVDHATCRNAFSRVIGISQLQVCAGQAPRGNCMGDSGGPLVQKRGNQATQIGIVSFSIPCAVPGYPDVFTRVAKFINWISSTTGITF